MIELAGGEDVLGTAGEKSRVFDWSEAEAANADVAVSMPCGYDAERAAEETRPSLDRLASLGVSRVVAVDASAYFSRPGPRLVDGVELLAHVLHPDRVAAPPPGRLVELDVSTPVA
jgi:iron complex transport system substrate-binding protein